MAIKTYTSPDGSYEYDYETVSIDHYRTGHIGGEADCGTCDGARCERCREQWKLIRFDVTERNSEPHIWYWEVFDNQVDAEMALAHIELEESY